MDEFTREAEGVDKTCHRPWDGCDVVTSSVPSPLRWQTSFLSTPDDSNRFNSTRYRSVPRHRGVVPHPASIPGGICPATSEPPQLSTTPRQSSMSTAPRIPTVRLPTVVPGASDESTPQDSVVLDLPPSGKFGFAWPEDTGPTPSIPCLADRHISLSSSDADSATSEHEHELEEKGGEKSLKSRRWSTGAGKKGHGDDESEESDFTTPTNRLNLDKNPLDQASPLPRLSRAFSVPLPSQIGYLNNPKRPPFLVLPPGSFPPTVQPCSDMTHFHELSLELADSVQMIIQTLLQLSPPQVFDPAKEQLSACALPIPTPSISALFTVMKSLNYMSTNMAAFSTPLPSRPCDPSNQTTNVDSNNPAISNPALQAPQSSVRDFDIGETLQSVGDAVSGLAADVGVDLVLFHGDVGMKHIAVKGDEIGICYTLSHVSKYSQRFIFYPYFPRRLYAKSSLQLMAATLSNLAFS
jgi:osomolarity two-component system, response regulator SSK1